MTVDTHDQKPLIPVWIAGASGFCGRGITQRLAEVKTSFSPHQGMYEVIPHLRPQSSRSQRLIAEWSTQGISPVIQDWSLIKSSIQQHRPQFIVSCLGTTKHHEKSGDGGYEEIDYGLNRQLIEIAEQLEIRPHFIYISSMGVQWGQWSRYLGARMKVERELKESSLTYSIIRPAILSGESRDEYRLIENFGSWLSHRLSEVFTVLGLQHFSDKVKPLNASEMGEFILSIIEEQHLLSSQREHVYPVEVIHKKLRDRKLSSC